MGDFDAANTAILGASYDTIAENLRFAEKNDFPYPLLADPERTLVRRMGRVKRATPNASA